VRTAPTTSPVVTYITSRSLPENPACKKKGVRDEAMKIAKEFEVDQTKALAMMWAASPDVRACLSTPTMESTEVGVQRTGP